MRLRALKKLSKRAAPILVKHYGREIFGAAKFEHFHQASIRCLCRPRTIFRRDGSSFKRECSCGTYALKGTPMTGETSGYYEPEWEERSAWVELCHQVLWIGRAATMTDREWSSALGIARMTEVRIALEQRDLEAWCAESAAVLKVERRAAL